MFSSAFLLSCVEFIPLPYVNKSEQFVKVFYMEKGIKITFVKVELVIQEAVQ